MAIRGENSSEDQTFKVCGEFLVDIFERSLPQLPTALTQSVKNRDWKTSHDLYLSFLLSHGTSGTSSTTAEYLAAGGFKSIHLHLFDCRET